MWTHAAMPQGGNTKLIHSNLEYNGSHRVGVKHSSESLWYTTSQ